MLEGPTILLVEDQVRHARLYIEALQESLGARVVHVSDGERAIRVLKGEAGVADAPAEAGSPDLILLDLDLPGLGGEAVLQAVKAEHHLRYVPVVVLTGDATTDRQLALLDQGADDFIEKGASPEILLARVRAQLRHRLTVERLERLALDRDLFAAGVLQDISGIKGTIVAQCRTAKEAVLRDVVGEKPRILEALTVLATHASRLGEYASDVIQSVRQTHKPPDLAPQDVEEHLRWLADVLSDEAHCAAGGGAVGGARFSWATAELKPVLADASLLRLALLNVVQRAVAVAGKGKAQLSISQHDDEKVEGGQRRMRVTTIRDGGPTPAPAVDLDELFRPFAATPVAGAPGDAGHGLGLALVARVMARMGGRAYAKRPADGGAGVEIALALPVP
jgi:DNA-binding response OmpR family regulator